MSCIVTYCSMMFQGQSCVNMMCYRALSSFECLGEATFPSWTEKGEGVTLSRGEKNS